MNLDDRTPIALRLAGMAALAGIIFAHFVGISTAFGDAFWIGAGYTAIVIGCAVCAVLLLLPSPTEQRRGWLFGGIIAVATLTAYGLTRITGLPNATEDKGNWGEQVGTWSTIAEGAMILLAAIALFSHRGHGPDTSQQIEDSS